MVLDTNPNEILKAFGSGGKWRTTRHTLLGKIGPSSEAEQIDSLTKDKEQEPFNT